MKTIVECVPNFSEGRDSTRVDAIVKALLSGPEVYLLDREVDPDHHRSVITFVATREQVGEAALRGVAKAAELIDLNRHRGAHPRLGATDVLPFVPVEGVTLADCVKIAQWVAEEIYRRFRIPTYLYEAAARQADRKNLESIRRGQFEGLRAEIRTQPARRPDFGGPELHPTAGATIVGARKFLIAYNINLNTQDVHVAHKIARKVRASSGGLPCVKAMGVELRSRGLVQVSLNLTDFEQTSIRTVFEAVRREAEAHGTYIVENEIVGLVPAQALDPREALDLQIRNFGPERVIENHLKKLLSENTSPAG